LLVAYLGAAVGKKTLKQVTAFPARMQVRAPIEPSNF
jgi:hypothetical protein